MKRLLLRWFTLLAALYLLICFAVYFFQELLLFHPEQLPVDYSFSGYRNASERWLNLGGARIDSLLFRLPQAKGTILLFHGNGGDLSGWAEVADELSARLRWNVWIVDYPGFGKSTGKITSEDQLHELAEGLWKMEQTELPASKLVIYGRSIGTGLAAKLAADHPPAGLVLESPYLSMNSLAKLKYPFLPSFLLRYPLPSDNWLATFGGPTLIFHGTADELIPVAQGQALAALAKKGKFVPIEGGHHNDLRDSKLYWTELERWLGAI